MSKGPGTQNSLLLQALLLVVLLVLTHRVTGQPLSYAFTHTGIEDGLPNPSVLDIMQDDNGFLWLGTFSGVVRYDGDKMKTYRPGNEDGKGEIQRALPKLYQDKQGVIWLALSAKKTKLYRYNPASDRFLPVFPDAASGQGDLPEAYYINAIVQDQRGRLLIGTLDGGLFALTFPKGRLEKPRVKQFRPNPENPYAIINHSVSGQMSEDQNGHIWIPTEGGLCRFDPRTDRFYPLEHPASQMAANEDSFCWSTSFYPPHTLWVGTTNKGVLRINTANGDVRQFRGAPDDPNGNSITRVIKDKEGSIWVLKRIGSGFEKVQQLDPETGRFSTVENERRSMRIGNIVALYSDSFGNIWVGAWQAGLFKLGPGYGSFQYIRFPKTEAVDSHSAVSAVGEDHTGRVWIGTFRDGMAAWDRNRREFSEIVSIRDFPEWFNRQPVYALEEAVPGQLLVGCDMGLVNYDFSLGAFTDTVAFRPEGAPTKIIKGHDGQYWIVNFLEGLFRFDPDGLSTRLMLEWSSIVSLYPCEDGSLLFGGNQFDFCGYWPGQDSLVEYLSPYGIHDIMPDTAGVAWLSTHSSGLIGYDLSTKQLVRLPAHVWDEIGLCRRILKDEQGMLWIFTATGLVQFDPYRRELIRSYDASNWLLPGEDWYYPFSSGRKLHDGTLVFGSASGALMFHPQRLQKDTTPVKVVITDFKLFNQSVATGPGAPLAQAPAYAKNAVLEHDQNDIALSFAALNFKPERQNAYRFRMLPAEQDWTPAGPRHEAYYRGLPPGNYTFEVQAALGDNGWQQEGARLQIIVRRPWYWTRLAQLVYLLLLTLLAYGLYRSLRQRYESRRLKELNTLKARLYTNITHEFRTPLTLILGYADQMQQAGGEAVQRASQMIAHSGRQLLRLVNQMLDLAKIDAGKLELNYQQADIAVFLKYLLFSFESAADQKGIQLSYHSEEASVVMDYDAGHLQQIVDNLLSNALKFTPEGGAVTLSVRVSGNVLQFTVRDTGIGISASEAAYVFDRFYMADSSMTRNAEGAGIGLAVTRDLAQLMGGDVELQSQKGRGTAFTVTLPITNKAPLSAGAGVVHPGRPAPLAPLPATAANQEALPLLLLVEDNIYMRDYLRLCLGESYRILEAVNGAEGLHLAKAEVPDLIISDVMMPKMDGYEMCRRLKAALATSHIPVIMLTAKADTDSRLQGLGLGAEAYLSKPFLPEELAIRVQNILKTRRQLKVRYQRFVLGPVAAGLQEDPGEAFLQRARGEVEKRLDNQEFGASQLHTALGLSRTQLHRKLSQLTGHSTGRFIRLVRIEHAKVQLRTTEKTVSEIAYQCGFNDPNYFSKVFKQETGLSPSDYRGE